MELFEKFGINWSLLIAQTVNFLIVLGVLAKFVYHPTLKLLNEREKKVAKSLKDAQEISKKLDSIAHERETIISQTRHQADSMIEEAIKTAQERQKTILEQTKQACLDLSTKTKNELRAAKNNIVKEATEDIADLVISATAKILQESEDRPSARQQVLRAISQLSKKN